MRENNLKYLIGKKSPYKIFLNNMSQLQRDKSEIEAFAISDKKYRKFYLLVHGESMEKKNIETQKISLIPSFYI